MRLTRSIRRVITSTRYLLSGLWSLRRIGRQTPVDDTDDDQRWFV